MSEVYYPPGVECFRPDGGPSWNRNAFEAGSCRVTEDMLDFLNLTSITNYMAAYCLRPAWDDSCPFGFCPNPDISGMQSQMLPSALAPAHVVNLLGPLVRIASEWNAFSQGH